MPSDALVEDLITADGYRLSTSRYPAQGPLLGRLIVAGATAVPQGFYRRFAQHAAARGFETLTFDYRGIGRSAPASLKGFRMDLLDWARQDLAAAVDSMAEGDVPLYLVGHSYGGHAFGLLPNHAKVAGFYVFGTSAGWYGYMPPLERLKVLTMWKVVLPVLTWWKGYCPWSALGLGEDLPEGLDHLVQLLTGLLVYLTRGGDGLVGGHDLHHSALERAVHGTEKGIGPGHDRVGDLKGEDVGGLAGG